MQFTDRYGDYEIYCGANQRLPVPAGRPVTWEAAVMLIHLRSRQTRLMFLHGEQFDSESLANGAALRFARRWVDEQQPQYSRA